jgi:uncharacterized protein YndB with AHSA1/START domain
MKSEHPNGGHRVEVRHRFAGSPSEIFSWWTTAEKLQQWSGCEGATKCEVTMDFRVGGSFTQKMYIAGRGEFGFRGTYAEIVEPERIVYTAAIGPTTTRVTVEFFGEKDGTEVVITHEGLPNKIFRKNISQGTTESFEELERVLGDWQPIGRAAGEGAR